jgi:transposase
MIRSKDHKFDWRLAMVRYARNHSQRQTAQEFRCSRTTVRKWVKRYDEDGSAGLHDRSRRPHSCPHQTSPQQEQRIVRLRQKTPCWGAARLKHEFDLAPSVGAISRILRENKLTRPRRKKYQRKNDLRAVKARYAPFSRLKIDVKFLRDIPHYWPYIAHMGLPSTQYTIREVRLGATFLAFGHEHGILQSTAVIERCLTHLADHGVPMEGVIVQSDGGGEFEGSQVSRRPGGFGDTIENRFGATHRIVPGCPNAQAEVESLHALIENEFFDIEDFTGPTDFWRKVSTYQAWFNLLRKNSYRGWNSPWDILKELDDAPDYDPTIFLLPPVHIDTLLPRHLAHHVPARPVLRRRRLRAARMSRSCNALRQGT